MAKKKSATKKAVKKSAAKKTQGRLRASQPTKRNAKAAVSRSDTKSLPILKALASVKASGAKAIEVHFHGAGDDGWYQYRVIGGDAKRPFQLPDTAENEINEFLQAHFTHCGEGPGSVLLARFDLVHSVCHGYSGDGDPGARLAELISVFKSHEASKIVGHLESGKFSRCKVIPASALSREEATDAVRRFLELSLEYAAEYGECDEEVGYDGEEYALLDAAGGTLTIDVTKRLVTLTQPRASKSIEIAVDRLIATSLPLRLA